jgi:hypothetical protein
MNGYSPGMFRIGYDCLLDDRYQNRHPNCGLTPYASKYNQAFRGAITDQAGVIRSSVNPAKLGIRKGWMNWA